MDSSSNSHVMICHHMIYKGAFSPQGPVNGRSSIHLGGKWLSAESTSSLGAPVSTSRHSRREPHDYRLARDASARTRDRVPDPPGAWRRWDVGDVHRRGDGAGS